MKSVVKKFVAVLLCVTMMFSSVLPHFASNDLINNKELSTTSDETYESKEETEESVNLEEHLAESASDDANVIDKKEDAESEEDYSESGSKEEIEYDEPESSESTVPDESQESIELVDTSESDESDGFIESSESSEDATDYTDIVEDNVATVSEVVERSSYDDVNVATNSDIISLDLDNLDNIDNIASKSEITTEQDKVNGLGFIPSGIIIPPVKESEFSEYNKLLGAPPLPSSYDPRNEELRPGFPKLPPVRDQGSFGTCWAFSTIGMFETYLRLHGLVDNEEDSNLSEAALTYFLQYGLKEKRVTAEGSVNIDKPGIEGFDYTIIDDRSKLGLLGGNQTRALLGMSSYMGPVIEDDNTRYEDKMADIAENGLDGKYAFKKNSFVIKDALFLNKKNRDLVKQAIMDNGSVGISYYAGVASAADSPDADAKYTHEFDGEYYYFTNLDSNYLNHAIMIVGWNDNIPKERFYFDSKTMAKEDGGWLCRNSWGGKGNGTNGYFWMSYEEPTLNQNMFSVVAMKADTYKYNYHYDTTGCAVVRGFGGNNVYLANLFQVSDDEDQVLEAVSVAISSSNVEFDIMIYTKDGIMKNPSDGVLRTTQSYVKDAAGIYTLELDDKIPLDKGTYFSIIMKPNTKNMMFFTDEHSTGGSYETVNEAKIGQSFYGVKTNHGNFSWNDFKDDNKQPSNLRIKALTNPRFNHVLDKNWYNESDSGVEKKDVTKITIQLGGTVSNYSAQWDIDDKGLKGYIVNNTDVIIHAPEYKIKTAVEANELFSGFTHATGLYGLSNLDTSETVNMSRMFFQFGQDCSNIDHVTIEGLESMDVSNVTDMTLMFAYANYIQGETLDLSKWDTAKLTTMNKMFRFHNGNIKNINLNGWNTTKLINMQSAFEDCYNVETIDMRSFDTSNVTTFQSCFSADKNLKTILTSYNFVTSSAIKTGITLMFLGCNSLVGGKGTSYASKVTIDSDTANDSTYAKIDAPGQEGYFTGEYTICTVTFNMNGHGTQINPVEVIANGKLTKPTDPTAAGYNFDGWYKDAQFVNKWNFNSDKIVDNITLFAKWTGITYTITYNANGGSVSQASVVKTYNTNVTLATPDRTGYTFGGWYSDSELKTSYNGTSDLSTSQGASVQIYAKWNENTYYITYYDYEGSYVSGYTRPSSRLYTDTTALPNSSQIIKTGHTFGGWYDNSSFTGSPITSVGPNKVNITVYAKWNEAEYTITLNENGGSYASGYVAPTKRLYHESKILPISSNITKEGYTFDGWYENSSFTGNKVTSVAANTTTNKEFWLKWNENKYSITYNENGGSYVSGYMKPTARLYSEAAELPNSSQITKTGYSFGGWYESSDFSGSALTNVPTNTASNKVLYAKWNENTYTINYELTKDEKWKTGYNPPNSRKYTESVVLPVESDIEKSKAFFLGWYKSGDTSKKIITSIPANTAENITLVANWDPAYYVTFNLGGSGENFDVLVRNGYKVKRPDKPTYQNKKFINWYADESLTTVFDFNSSITQDKTLYAKWEDVITYTVTFNLQNGSDYPAEIKDIEGVPAVQYVESGTKATKPSSPVSKGYSFKGWFAEPTFETSFNFNSPIYGHKIVYGKWEELTYSIKYIMNSGEWVDGYAAPSSWKWTKASSVSLPTEKDIVRKHYKFDGWYKDENFTEQVTSLSEIETDLRLYAKWTVADEYFVINFVSGGGTGTMSTQLAFKGESTVLVSNTFTRAGYSFKRWYAGEGKYYADGANIGEVTKALSLTAEWSKNPGSSSTSTSKGRTSSNYGSSGGSGGSGGSSGSGGGISVAALAATLPNGQSLTQAAQTVTTVSANGVVEKTSTDAVTGIVSTEVSMNFNSSSVMFNTTQSKWQVGESGKWHLHVLNDLQQVVEPLNAWACINSTVVTAQGQATVVSDFYFFNGKGEMVTGWLNDASGKTYFLETEATSEQGKMARGWKSIAGKYYYFNTDGTLMKGGVTPDGYVVDTTGAWST